MADIKQTDFMPGFTDNHKRIIWETELHAIGNSLAIWNQNVVPWMKERGEEYKKFAHAEAKKRGYEFDKGLMQYREPWRMHALKGRNCIAAGVQDNTLRIAFASKNGARFYTFVDLPEAQEIFHKLKNSPFPDKLFANYKSKYQMKAIAE